MKLTTFLLIIALVQASAKGYSQITLHEKNAPLEKVLKDLKQQSGYTFIYENNLIDQEKVSLDVNNVSIENALAACFSNLPLSYKLVDKTVVIQAKESSFFDNLKSKIKAELAQVTVKGKVIDSLGEPIAAVTIKEKGTNNATVTDTKGAYTLTVTDNNAIIVFSYVGYQPKEAFAKDLANGSATVLHEAISHLREVSINKGYYTEKQSLSTGDVAVVSSKTIEQQPVADPIQALVAQVPGLFITQNSGIPGSVSIVRLRGQNSLQNGNDPLYLIDGVPFSNNTLTPGGSANSGAVGQSIGYGNSNLNGGGGLSPFNLLNAEDIESIEVLKDADATAIYGSRGANGVILITTKRGHAGNTQINVDFSQGASKVGHFMDLMNTQQYLKIRHQAFAMDGITPGVGDYDINGVWDTTRNTNWQKMLIGGTGLYSNAQVSISGGDENTQFYIGSGFNRNTTVFPGDFEDEKSSLNFNLAHSSADKRFLLQFSGGYTHDNDNLPAFDLTGTALTLAPDAPALYKADGSLNWQTIGGTGTFSNPLAYTLQTADGITNSLTSNLLLSYRILRGLSLRTNMGYHYATENQTNLTPGSSIAPPNNTNSVFRSDRFGNSENTNWIIEPQLTYVSKIGKGNLSALAGISFQQNYSYSASYGSSGYTSDALLSNPSNASVFKYTGETDVLYRYSAAYARVGYTWEDKYLFNITARRDGSSRFGPGKQWGNFGAIGTGWVFSKENFIEKNLPVLSFGKLRASYGITGNDQIGDYQYLSSYSSNSSTYQGATGLSPTRIPNPYYGWEINKKLEGGIELGFLKDRINFTANYYQNRSGDQLVGYPLPNISGFTSVQYNLPAIVQNSGAEFTLNTINIQSGGFKWNTSINLTIPSNKLLSFPGLSTSNYASTYALGQSIFINKAFSYSNVNSADGVYQFHSASGALTENPSYPADLVNTPPVTQQFYGMLSNNFSYKGFELYVSFQFVKQYEPNYYGSVLYSAGSFNYNLPTIFINNTWQNPGDIKKFGRLSTEGNADPNGDTGFSTIQYGDASFIRLKNAALSYTLPKSWQAAMHLKNVRIYLEGQNLVTFTNYFGLDPETGTGSLPPLRTIVFGIHASL